MNNLKEVGNMNNLKEVRSYLKAIENLEGEAKINYICSYIDSQAKKLMNHQANWFLDSQMVFSELAAKVKVYHDGDYPIYKDELQDIVHTLTDMKYEVQYEVIGEYIAFWLTK
jgi:hypothetical protein